MRFLIAGAGAIGGYIGACMARAGLDVLLYARGPHLRAMQERGLRILSTEGDFEVPRQSQATWGRRPGGCQRSACGWLDTAYPYYGRSSTRTPRWSAHRAASRGGTSRWGGRILGFPLPVSTGRCDWRISRSRHGRLAGVPGNRNRTGCDRHRRNRDHAGEPDGSRSGRLRHCGGGSGQMRCPFHVFGTIWVSCGNVAFHRRA
jgi:choline dehydrogenase-like flavoprotein